MDTLQMISAVKDARRTEMVFNDQCEQLAKLLVGHLRSVSKDGYWRQHEILRKLKAELSQYNAVTKKWKS